MRRCNPRPGGLRTGGVIAIFASLALLGCANLQAVREFAKTSAETANYHQIVSDYIRSAERQKHYQPAAVAAQLDALARARAEQRAKLEGAQRVLVQYLSALGDLAADQLPNVDSEVDRLGKALEKAKFVGDGDAAIGKETASACAAIVKVLTRAVLDHWRQAQVSRIIRETDESVQAVVAGLREVVLLDFSASLDTEAEAIRKYFQGPIADATSRNDLDAVPPLARILMIERLEQVEGRRGRLKAYADVLSRIGRGHSDLRQNVETLDDPALAQRLKQYAKDLKTLYNAIQDLEGR